MSEVLIRRAYRIGVQAVEVEDGRYYVWIKNRSYQSRVEVPVETARRYYEALRARS